MARKGITKDQVFNAASAIKARGLEPTIASIRAEIGEGSFTTISQHLAAWKSETADHVEMSSLPPEVEEKALEVITTLWSIAAKEAGKDIKAVKQSAADTEKELQKEIDIRTEEISILENHIEKSDKENDLLKENIDKLLDKIHKLEVSLAKKEGELEALKGTSKPQKKQQANDKKPVDQPKKEL